MFVRSRRFLKVNKMDYLILLAVLMSTVDGLNNGLARTPPMGWLDWERFRCNTDCVNDPENCISERLFMEMADRIVADGYLDAGYEYVNIDDCWPAKERDDKGRLVPDPDRFPNGIIGLAKYIHSKGLKLGIYEDFGTLTCGGYPGSEFYLQLDAQTFADWEVDLLKFDGCYSDPADMKYGYPIMGKFLNLTGRPILYSCSWPAYIVGGGSKKMSNFSAQVGAIPPYKQIAETCNIWRNYGDIQDSWDSILSIIEFYGKNEGNFSEVAGPGNFNDPDMPNYTAIASTCNMWRNHGDIEDTWDSVVSIINYYGMDTDGFAQAAGPGGWNDPDMLIVGDFGLSLSQQKAQMAMWCIMASPLFMSNDLRKISPESKAILQNRNAIRVNQDPMGVQGRLIFKEGSMSVWSKPIMPNGTVAFAVLNTGTAGTPSTINFPVSSLGQNPTGYNITEVFDQIPQGIFKPSQNISVSVDPTSVVFAVANPI